MGHMQCIRWTLIAAVLLAGCPGGGNGGGPDGSAGELEGTWRIVSLDGVGNEGPDRAAGTVQLAGEQIARVLVEVEGDRLERVEGFVDRFSMSSAGDELVTRHNGSFSVEHVTGPPEQLTLDASGTYERYTHTASDLLTVVGAVSVEQGAGAFTPIATPRVGIVYITTNTSNPEGPPSFIEVPGGDMALADFGADDGQTTTFDLSRVEGALGVERIVFGDAFASIGLVIVYDDVNGNGLLDDLWESCGAGQDCVRGLSPLIVAYRSGTSPELLASPFAYLMDGWTPAAVSGDYRAGDTPELGLVSVERSPATPPFDVVVVRDPSNVTLPAFEL
jgi:hypothetical protein